MVKLNSINIQGFRGIKNEMEIQLVEDNKNQSILIYADNGKGKSSITDAIEWVYKKSINHLSSMEIDKVEALRNIFLNEGSDTFIELTYTDDKLNCKDVFFTNKNKKSSEKNNVSVEYSNYLLNSQQENLILRYSDMIGFIIETKKDKLVELSKIIGFQELFDLTGEINKVKNKLNKLSNDKSINESITINQQHLLEELGQNITEEGQLFEAVNNIIEPLKLNIKIQEFSDIDEVLKLIKNPEDDELINIEKDLEKAKIVLNEYLPAFRNLFKLSHDFVDNFNEFIRNKDKIKLLGLINLLTEGAKVVENKYFDVNKCPLCLSTKEHNELLPEIHERIKELKSIDKEQQILEEMREEVLEFLNKKIKEKTTILKSQIISEDDKYENIYNIILIIENFILNLKNEIKKDILDGISMAYLEKTINLDELDIENRIELIDEHLQVIKEKKQTDKKFDINSKIEKGVMFYKDILILERKKKLIRKEHESFEIIYSEIKKRQDENLKLFLDNLSNDIKDYYLFMNSNEGIIDINLIPIEKDDEIIGITIQIDFHDNLVNPPQTYLSESHLNCMGLAFFLASVKAFNKVNGFFVLDDVISTYDKDHRNRFLQLIVEKFSEYQIILLTHERDFLEIALHALKGKSWLIKELKWDSEENTPYFGKSIVSLKEQIIEKINKDNISNLGNDMRKYMESILKEIAENLDVKVSFKSGSKNEQRGAHELLVRLKSELKDVKCELSKNEIFTRLISDNFIENLDSHDNVYNSSLGELKGIWKDISEFEDLFRCKEENCTLVSLMFYDKVEKKIRCKCGNKKYTWKC
ncbi:hypothetical protein KAU33_17010 [Candidatus Dependentiae bacterium]|nr:hypothetical protein [Candidatus Dependentiae bacterium]